MNWLLEPFRDYFMQRALVVCMLVGFSNGFLGSFVVLRRLALMADALSHSLMPGLVVGLILFGFAPKGLFFGALSAALFVAVGAQLLSKVSRIKEDTALGILYTMAFSFGIVMLTVAKSPIDLAHWLFGDILGVSDSDLWVTYGISLGVIPLLVALQRPLILVMFDPVVALSQGVRVSLLNLVLMVSMVLVMVSSVQAIGPVVMLGLLIAPAATMYLLCDSYPLMLWGGGILAMIGSFLGLLVSYWTNAPSGACIVLVLGVFFCFAFLFSPRYGLLTRLFRRSHLHEQSLARWPKASEG
jgi:ABC-type Mn2+/Zn2+ transport system permease subunit